MATKTGDNQRFGNYALVAADEVTANTRKLALLLGQPSAKVKPYDNISAAIRMTNEVVVTEKGQTTIPVDLRRKYGIERGTRLKVQDVGEGILLRPVTSTIGLAGSGAKQASPEGMKALLDRLRA